MNYNNIRTAQLYNRRRLHVNGR